MASQTVVLPGEEIPGTVLPVPSNSKHALKLGPGLRQTRPATITSTLAGTLGIDYKKNAIWVKNGDLVIATVHHSSAEVFQCSLTPHTAFAQLPQLGFQAATKRTRPQLPSGSLVYARVSSASKHTDAEILCYNASTGKSEGMGELKGGMLFEISLGMALRLLMAKQKEDGGLIVLEEMAEKMAFEIAVGRNGKVWVKSERVKDTLAVGGALQETDQKGLGLEEQEKLVRKLMKDI
ncbi:MAG: hypothetical protein Q9163_005585 [Psora crenata]